MHRVYTIKPGYSRPTGPIIDAEPSNAAVRWWRRQSVIGIFFKTLGLSLLVTFWGVCLAIVYYGL
jgi:hypothetical protein